jgi:hypothetical protein
MTKPNNPNNGDPRPSARDPLSLIRGDARLDAVWRDVLRGDSTRSQRATLIYHFRAEREKFLGKAEKEPTPHD